MICKSDWQQNGVSRQQRQTWSEVFFFFQVSAKVPQFHSFQCPVSWWFCPFLVLLPPASCLRSCTSTVATCLSLSSNLILCFVSCFTCLFVCLRREIHLVFQHISFYFLTFWILNLIWPQYQSPQAFLTTWVAGLVWELCQSSLILSGFFILLLFSCTSILPTYFFCRYS